MTYRNRRLSGLITGLTMVLFAMSVIAAIAFHDSAIAAPIKADDDLPSAEFGLYDCKYDGPNDYSCTCTTREDCIKMHDSDVCQNADSGGCDKKGCSCQKGRLANPLAPCGSGNTMCKGPRSRTPPGGIGGPLGRRPNDLSDDPIDLHAPSDLAIVAQQGTTVTLRWSDNSFLEEGFRIDFFAGKRFIRFYSAPASQFRGEVNHTLTLPNVPTRQICFQVRAFIGDAGKIGTAASYPNASFPSERVCGQSQGVDPARFEVPAAPSDLRVELISRTHVRLFWQDNSDNEEGWLVDVGVASGSVRWESEPTTVPNFIETDGPTTGERDIDLRNMPPGILPLCFRIRAFSSGRKSGASQHVCTPQRRIVR